MAITINKPLEYLPNTGTGNVILSDNPNVIEFTSNEETNKLDFKFKIDITVTPQGAGNTATALNYTTYRQYGYLSLYSIINSKKLYSKLGFNEIVAGIGNVLKIERSLLTIKITETWIQSGARYVNTSSSLTISGVRIHNGIASHRNFAPKEKISFRYNNTISTRLSGWYFPQKLNDSDVFLEYNGTIYSTFAVDYAKEFNGLTIDIDTLVGFPFQVKDELGQVRYDIGVSDCVENNFISWLNDAGYFEVFNFEHSHEKMATSTGQDYYTNHKKTAIVSTQNTITLSTSYINEDTYAQVLNILESPDVYWNGIPVTPIRKGVKYERTRFEKLISLTLEFEISKKEKSILR
jgi:hypothetical protein